MKRIGIKRMSVLAGLVVISAVANAFLYDATVTIDRALNSPTLTVRYSGETVALVELRLNGVSVGTRTITAATDAGETNFTLDLGSLKDGENQVEVRLFDKGGKLVGTEKSTITTEDGIRGPIFLSAPKVGATVQGPIYIKLGFGRAMRDVYASFFVDNQFKSLINMPPYDYLWDTSRETNGWHTVEAWVVDDSSTTFKTQKVKVFVNNPSGNTPRQDPPADSTKPAPKPAVKQPVKPAVRTPHPNLQAIPNPVRAGATGGPTMHVKPGHGGANPTAVGTHNHETAPSTSGIVSGNPVHVAVGQAVDSKETRIPHSLATGPKHLTPTGTRVATTQNTGVPHVATVPSTTVNSATQMIRINYGQRLPNLPTYAIILDSKYVDFDVSPRVQDGIPLTPIRHLLESAGGDVNWDNASKIVDANAEGRSIWLKIGERYARVNKISVEMERAPFIERGRTVVPLSFIRSTLNVDIEYDPTTGHVLITSKK